MPLNRICKSFQNSGLFDTLYHLFRHIIAGFEKQEQGKENNYLTNITMTGIKKILFRVLGLKNYLRVLHKSFHFLYRVDFLKRNNTYKYHYFDQKIIQKGDTILDIGANLGYYTALFAKWTGESGKVYAVEPVVPFYETIKWGTKKYNNIITYNCALGEEEKEVTLATPDNFGYLRTGLPHVIDQSPVAEKDYEFAFKARMEKASILFGDLPQIDFIKCDIEGYEEYVLPEMKHLIERHKPIIQVETWGDHKSKLEQFLFGAGYEAYDVENNRLKPANEVRAGELGDLLFIHKDNHAAVFSRLERS